MILIASKSMDSNKKPDRDEHNLIRMPANARKNFETGSSPLEITGKVQQKLFNVHEAFSNDIKNIKHKFSTAELKRVGFVTTEVFEKLTGKIPTEVEDVWVAKLPNTTLIGADPEFLLFNAEGEIVRANNILAKPGKIGSDGAMIEIRPDPAVDPIILVKNMKEIFKNKELTAPIKDLEWTAAVYHKDNLRDYPVGGHIHIGNPADINKLTPQAKIFLFAVINKILDELLAIPLIKLDGTDLGKFRRSECQMAMGNVGYGYYGEWRSCDGRLEHRTLSGLWLMHPFVAECVLGVAKAISEEIFKKVEDSGYNNKLFSHPGVAFKDHKFLYRGEFNDWDCINLTKDLECINSSAYMINTLNQSRASSITKSFLKVWYKKMIGLSTYKKYSIAIDGLYNILLLPKGTINKVGFNIKENWLNNKKFPI